jgi:hyperosmotically inducible periplasmic protein
MKTASLPNAGSTATAPDSASPNAALAPSNAAAMPAQDTSAAPDNSRINARDKSASALTPMDQGTSEGDRKITQQIRQAVVKDGSLSFTAKNVKIITINGKVTLRGPVKTAAERSAIEAAAKNVAGAGQVDNQLDVKN